VARLSKRRRQELAQPGPGTATMTRTAPAPTGTGAASSPAEPRGARAGPSASARGGGRRAAPPSRYQTHRVKVGGPWWQSPWAWGGGLTALVAVVVIVFVILAVVAPTASPDPLADQGVVNQVTSVTASNLATVGGGQIADPLMSLPSSTPGLASGGKPEFLFVGEDSCPYCAFDRWSVVVALSRFGSFTNLHFTQSATNDLFPNTDSFSFYGSSYSSPYLAFVPVETADRNGRALQTPTADEQSLVNAYDAPPYSSSTGGVPWMDLGGRYVAAGAPTLTINGQVVDGPALLQGMTWQQIGQSLSNPSSAAAVAILSDANWLIAGLCKITGDQPASVCGTSTVTTLEGTLPTKPPTSPAS